nr:MAG TPA: hypothetical protein [Caudoviricetes sp.]
MCLDSECVSKSTVSVAGCSVSIWHGRGFRPRGLIGVVVGKGADKVYYDILVGRPSAYRGIFERGILVRAWGKINVTSATQWRRRNRMLSETGTPMRV